MRSLLNRPYCFSADQPRSKTGDPVSSYRTIQDSKFIKQCKRSLRPTAPMPPRSVKIRCIPDGPPTDRKCTRLLRVVRWCSPPLEARSVPRPKSMRPWRSRALPCRPCEPDVHEQLRPSPSAAAPTRPAPSSTGAADLETTARRARRARAPPTGHIRAHESGRRSCSRASRTPARGLGTGEFVGRGRTSPAGADAERARHPSSSE